jgi:thioredoxin-dependent peroxiredoxin
MPLFKNKPVTFNGVKALKGTKVKDFKVMNNAFEEVKYSNYNTFPIKVISVVPSLDTSVCSLQTSKVNTELAKDKRIVVLTISNDLPFAQKRWCGNSGIENIITLSDYLHNDFGSKFGILMNEFKLLARAVYIVNSKDEIVYVEYVDNMSTHPNYDELLKHLNAEINNL